MKDIFEMLGKMDKKELDEAIKRARQFAVTPEGQKMAEKLRSGKGIDEALSLNAEQKKSMEKLRENPEIAKKIASLLGKGK